MSSTTVSLSLPTEQLQLLDDVKALLEQKIALENGQAFLKTEQAAERLKVSVSTLNAWREEGWLRFFQQGSTIRYRTDYLDQDFEKRAMIKTSALPLQRPLNRRAS